MRSVAGTLKIDLAQFRDLEAFATFGSELDKASQAQLDRGYRLTEILKQPQSSPAPVEEQVIAIYSGTGGFADDVAVSDMRRFESELVDFFKSRHGDLLEHIRAEKQLPRKDELDAAINEFKQLFSPGEPGPASDAPASDAPASDAPASDAPASDAPASDAPASDAPASDE